jgi:predicted RNA-binding Zn-ribbon protein involved in translation (DUF1610 family)
MSMKYRHRGYRDSERDDRDRGGRPPRPPLAPDTRPPQDRSAIAQGERAQQRSLKHAVDREAREAIRCPSCGRNVPMLGMGSEMRCTSCGASLRACRTCKHFDTSARWECRISDRVPARVADKAAENACPMFTAQLILDATGKRLAPAGGSGPRSNDPKSLFENLFKR